MTYQPLQEKILKVRQKVGHQMRSNSMSGLQYTLVAIDGLKGNQVGFLLILTYLYDVRQICSSFETFCSCRVRIKYVLHFL